MTGFEISILVVIILVTAIPASLVYAYYLAPKYSPKAIQTWTIVGFIIFVLYFAFVVNTPGSLVPAIFGSMMVGTGFGLWYSLNTAHLMKLIPADQKAGTRCVCVANFFGIQQCVMPPGKLNFLFLFFW